MAGITVRFDMAPGATLPEFAAACTELRVADVTARLLAVSYVRRWTLADMVAGMIEDFPDPFADRPLRVLRPGISL